MAGNEYNHTESNVHPCHICGQPAEFECEKCGESYCDNCGVTYNQFSQIDYDCCKECQEYIEKN